VNERTQAARIARAMRHAPDPVQGRRVARLAFTFARFDRGMDARAQGFVPLASGGRKRHIGPQA
jgi:hypothetical protein